MIVNNSRIELKTAGCSEEFISMYLRCNKKLYITALVMLNDYYEAEDAVQDTLILAIKGFDRLRNKESFDAWILKILINRCKRLKFIRFRGLINNECYDITSHDEGIIDSIVIREALVKLSYKYRIVIMLRFFNDLKISQISEILNIPEGTIKSQLNRGLKELKTVLNGGV